MNACKNAKLPPNSCPTPAHLPDVGGDTPAAATHSSADLIKGIENKWGESKQKWPKKKVKVYQVVLINQWQCVIEHFLLISFLKIQIWNTGISFLFDHVVPQWPAGPLRSNHYNFCNRNLSNNRIFPNNRRKSINQIFISIRHFSINNRNISIKHSSSWTEYK